LVELRQLSRSWGSFALREIDLRVGRGEYFVLLGPTACGKTLLLETIAGIHRPYRGVVRLDGVDVASVPAHKRGIGFVYQRSMLFPNLTVAENVEYGMRMRRVPRKERVERVQRLAELLKIGYLLARDVRDLSGGESQKVALARALAIEPKILLLDEPLSPLDEAAKEELLVELRDLHSELGTTSLHVTHDHRTARQLADRVGIMDNGQLVQVGAVTEVFEHPCAESVAHFVRAQNILLGESRPLAEGVVEVQCVGFAVRACSTIVGPAGICILPERVSLHLVPPQDDSRNVLGGVVRSVENEAGVARVTLDLGKERLVALVPQETAAGLFATGHDATVYASFPTDAVHVFVRSGEEETRDEIGSERISP